jgi:hypothetical protein
LTEAGLSNNDVNFDSANWKKLSRTATEHIYDYIDIMAQVNRDVQYYRIAKSLFGRHRSEKEGRKEVERMLARQADFISEFGDARKTPKTVVDDKGRIIEQKTMPESGFWLEDSVLVWLDRSRLIEPNITHSFFQIDWSSF